MVDHWGGHALTFKDGSITLEPGLHHVHIDYQELAWGAGIMFKMGLGKQTPVTPDPSVLIFPGLDQLGPTPCEGLD